MWLVSRVLFVVFLSAVSFGAFAEELNWSPVLKGKIEKALNAIYTSTQLEFETVLDKDYSNGTKIDLEAGLFKVMADGEFKGYAYVAQAPSMKNVFDYLVVFNKDLSIEKAKVLIYREQHGRQIGTARWLSQFKGLNYADEPELGKSVDGISGATISARSFTNSVRDLLAALAAAKEEGAL